MLKLYSKPFYIKSIRCKNDFKSLKKNTFSNLIIRQLVKPFLFVVKVKEDIKKINLNKAKPKSNCKHFVFL